MKSFPFIPSTILGAIIFSAGLTNTAIAESAININGQTPAQWLKYDYQALTEINRQLASMLELGESDDPLVLTPQLFGLKDLSNGKPLDPLEQGDLRIVASEQQTDANDRPYLLVSYLLEGLRDDSVRGQWLRITYAMDGDRWRITSVKEAYLCRRGDDTDSYNGRLCP